MKFSLTPRRLLAYFMAVSVPVLLFLNVWQGVRYTRLREEVRRLEDEQVAWFERNKNLLAAIGIYSSPKRIDALAEEDPALRKASPEDMTRVEVVPDRPSSSSGGKGDR